MRDLIINALKTKLVGQMNGHIANIEVMVTNPVGVGDHPTIIAVSYTHLTLPTIYSV